MAEKLALPILLPSPSPAKPLVHHHLIQPLQPRSSPSSPLPQSSVPPKPLLKEAIHQHKNPNSETTYRCNAENPSLLHLPRRRRPLGKHRDPNRGKPWTHTSLSAQGQQIFQILVDPDFDCSNLDQILIKLFENHGISESEDVGSLDLESVNADILGIVKGLGFLGKCDLALNVFNWVRSRNNYQTLLNGPVVAVMISILGKEGHTSVAAYLISELNKDGFDIDVYAYTAMVSACASNGRYREAVRVFRKMEDVGCKPTLVTYNVILNVYGKMGMPWIKITEIMDNMKRDGIAPDLYTYNTLISCCRRGSLYEEAAKTFEEMKLAGFVPDKVTYNVLLDVCGKSRRPKEAIEVLQEMETHGGGLLDEAMELKAQMVKRGIKPDVFTYTTLFSGFEKAGKDECAMKVFKEMRNTGCKPNICTFNALIKMHGNRKKFSEMMQTFEDMKRCKCSPDIVTWNSLLAVFGQSGMDAEVSILFSEMKRSGFVPERDTFNTLISAYSRCGSFNQSMAIYKMMLEAGVIPDLSTYNAVLAALARGGLWEESEKVFAEMQSRHCKPNELSYSCLLHAYANGKQIERMGTLAEKVYSAEITLHPVLLKTLVLVNSKTDLLGETERAFGELRKINCSLDITTLNAMVSIYGRRQMIQKANEILDFITARQFTPSLTTYNSLMYMYSRSGSFLRAEEVLNEIVAKGLQPDIISYNTVIYAYCRSGRLRDASRIFTDMRGSGIIPDVVTYNIFIACYAANDMFLEAIDMVCYMINHHCRPNQSTYNSIVDFYCKFNHLDEATMFIKNLCKLDPCLPRDEETRLLERIKDRYSRGEEEGKVEKGENETLGPWGWFKGMFKKGYVLKEMVLISVDVTKYAATMENGDVPSRYQNVALIVGVTGISGNSLADILQLTAAPGGRWKVYGVARRRQPEWQFHHNHVQYIQCEMVDPEDTQAKLSHLSDVTHIFYVGWVTKSTEAESQHICLQTGQKYALPIPDSLSEIQHEPQFVEDFPREAITNCYYSMEDILCEQVQRKENLTWSIHRPAVMFGFSPYSTRNIVGRRLGGRAAMWGAIYQQGKSHAFNCSNGDMFKWKDLWKVLADEFGVKFVEFEDGSDSLEEMMREKGPVWDHIVQEKELLTTRLEEIGTWWYVDSVLRREAVSSSPFNRSMEKSKEFGFWGSRDTIESFRFWIEHTRRYKIVP
ncbi:hypothetical protein RDABS01_035470 [Bienertia sinuspersici]